MEALMKSDNIELLREEIHRKDLQLIQKIRKKDISLIEERFKKWEKGCDWDDFVRTIEIDVGSCEDAKIDCTPMNIMCRFIENDGDPLVYLKAVSVSYPGHPFCQMLIGCETVSQFLTNLKPMESRISILFQDAGKKWLSELFCVSKGSVEEEFGIQAAADLAAACP